MLGEVVEFGEVVVGEVVELGGRVVDPGEVVVLGDVVELGEVVLGEVTIGALPFGTQGVVAELLLVPTPELVELVLLEPEVELPLEGVVELDGVLLVLVEG
ncbi:MAG TPA: hypothetical protein VG488_12495 [Candidatus Angelobacter sp.]|nr:hypothetical protein [Candidatus Angelobacter sp.]